MAPPLLVPRRRVRVELQLADGQVISGDAYVAADGDRGGREHLADRLNDTSERFLPIAVGDRHLLIRKSAIVSAFTADTGESAAHRDGPTAREIAVEVTLCVGSPLRGDLIASARAASDRALDLLNGLAEDFVRLADGAGVTLVNTRHVVAVTERSTHHAATTRALASATSRRVDRPGDVSSPK